ncbi:MAG TPA: aminopeptidase P family protein [Actinomycetota bacterium]|nr:aminopeptidase P family protein [Actinomycetota bacterium]
MDHHLRRSALAERLAGLEVDALLVTGLTNVRYLTGSTGSNGQVLVDRAGGAGVFFTDGRYTEQSRHEVPDMERVTYSGAFAEALVAHLGVERLGFEAEHVTVRAHERLSAVLGARVDLVACDDEVEHLRWIKDDDELELLNSAQAVTDQAFDDVLETLAVGVTELQVARRLEELLRRDGADGISFESIVAFGEHAAEPHHGPTHRPLEEGDVITMDFGALYGGYHADMTRTVAFGQPAAELRKIHDTVREAQQAGIAAVREGVTGAEVDAAARGVIEGAGYGERFSHGLGHGVGLEIHEGPRLGREFTTHTLASRAVVTVEPGIYVPGLGGARIEDMVEVTPDGCRVLGNATRELMEL